MPPPVDNKYYEQEISLNCTFTNYECPEGWIEWARRENVKQEYEIFINFTFNSEEKTQSFKLDPPDSYRFFHGDFSNFHHRIYLIPSLADHGIRFNCRRESNDPILKPIYEGMRAEVIVNLQGEFFT